MGDILPNKDTFRYKTSKNDSRISSLRLGNITLKVLNAIDSVLDMFFAYKSEEFTNELILIIEGKGKIMEANINILWNLKQTLCFESLKLTGMRKLHAHNHIGEHIHRFGAPVYADTDSYESAHKKFTTGLWRNSSRRHNGLIKEMTDATIRQQHCSHLRMISELQSWNGTGNFESKYFAPHTSETRKYYEKKPITPLLSSWKYACLLGKDERNVDLLVGYSFHHDVILLDKYFGHKSIPDIKKLSHYLMSYFEKNDVVEVVSNSMCPVDEFGFLPDSKYSFNILQGAIIRGDVDSGVEPGIIYCTPDYKGEFKRYDYVVVEVEYDDGTKAYPVAQVITIIAMMHPVHKIEEAQYLFIVQYLQNDNKPVGVTNEFNNSFKQLRWEQKEVVSRGKKQIEFVVDCIAFENIVDTAVIIPFFSFENKRGIQQRMPIMGQPDKDDRFYYLEKRYFDRSGWNELSTVGVNNNNHSLYEYIKENFIGTLPTDENAEDENAEEDEDTEEGEDEEEAEDDEEEEDEGDDIY